MKQSQSMPTPLTFMPQLDGLRAIAVGAVLIHHLLSLPSPLAEFEWGHAGVLLFFVLSGFLITGILLRARIDSDLYGTSPLWVIRQFYARRFLRIFPLYYFVIFAGAIINLPQIREDFWWLVSYLFNFKIAYVGWFPENIAHFWTLAVEEQFYLFWPWFMLFAPRWALFPLSLTMIAIGPVFRALIFDFGLYGPAFYVLTPGCLDSFGIGAALAIMSRGQSITRKLLSRLSWFALPLGLLSVITVNTLSAIGSWHYTWYVHVVFYDTGLALLFCWIVAAASRGISGPIGRFLTLTPITYCGRIAYGIYVYHLLLAMLIYKIGVKIGLGWKWGDVDYFIVTSLITIATAAVSWHFMEKPLNDEKRRFPYKHPERSIRRSVFDN